jgi:hypothetical protein
MLLRRIRDFWGSAPVEFESAFGLPESVERLKAATRRSVFSALVQQEAVGTVKQARVSLQRAIPMVGNAFKPFYRGHFIERDGKAVLVGRFAIHWVVKVFMSIWFGGIACFTLLACVSAAEKQSTILFPLIGLGMIGAGAALVWLGKWFARNDAAWLTVVIQGALHAQGTLQSTYSSPNDNSFTQSPTTINIAAAVLLLAAFMCWLGAIFGIQSAQTSPHGFIVTHFPHLFDRYFSAAFGTVMFVLAFGIWRRVLMAWRAGLVLIAGNGFYFVVQLLDADKTRPDPGVIVVTSVASLLVTVYWIRWWYAQRRLFRG